MAEDDNKAFALLTEAANAGNALAQINLGYLYLNGRGAPMDKYQGMVWTVKAGEQGNPAALYNIANAYFRGGALPKNNDKAAYYMAAAFTRSTPAVDRFIENGINETGARHEHGRRQARSGPGAALVAGSRQPPSDVLDDAKTRQKTAQNWTRRSRAQYSAFFRLCW